MSLATRVAAAGQPVPCEPWPHTHLQPAAWAAMAAALATDPAAFIALWADTMHVYALFAGPLLVSAPVTEGAYAALSPWRPAASGFERMIRDLWGHEATGATDARPLLDHGAWDIARPLSGRPGPSAGPAEPALRPAPPGLAQLRLGPVMPGVTEPAHWRLHVQGETVRQAEARLGYAHKGALVLMRSKSPRAAARYAARIAGDATVAHSLAFARAAEAALGVDAPPRAHVLRGIMAELERAAVHLDNLAGLCRAAGAEREAGRLGLRREALLHAAALAFGHRLMMDCVVPGGVAGDITTAGIEAIRAAAAPLRPVGALPGARLLDRLAGLGLCDVDAFAPGGLVGRAAGQPGDARIAPGYPPYDAIPVHAPVLQGGGAAAQARLRGLDVAESARLLAVLLDALPPGPLTAGLPAANGEGLAVAESSRGEVWHWLRLDGGMVAAVFVADPGWRLWPLAERALAGCALEDVELVMQAIGASAAAVDL